MKSDLPMRHRYVITNMVVSAHHMFLGRSTDGYEWVRMGPLRGIMTFDERADAVKFSERIPRSADVAPEVICAWMPDVDEILDVLDVPASGRNDVGTLRAAIGNLWVRGVLEVDRLMRQSEQR